VNARIGDVYFDTCTLSNFAAVGRLNILEERYGHRARWTETVQFEVRRGIAAAPYLRSVLNAAWLGEPIEIGGGTSVLTEINNIRRGLGALPGNQTQHLGEAEIIYCLQFVDTGAFFIPTTSPRWTSRGDEVSSASTLTGSWRNASPCGRSAAPRRLICSGECIPWAVASVSRPTTWRSARADVRPVGWIGSGGG
jgi:hypothetical protein